MRIAVFAALALALLAGLWIGLRPAPIESAPALAAPDTAELAIQEAAPAPQRFSLTVPPVPGDADHRVLRVQAGERVELTVTSAADDELHLHGYDLALPLRAGEPATLAFAAEHAGRFEIELHYHHAELGVLEVSPR